MRFIIFGAFCLLLSSCAKEFLNPYDPATPPDSWMPRDFVLDTLDNNSVRLSWQQDELHIDGYTIRRDISGDIREFIIPFDSLMFTDLTVIDSIATDTCAEITYSVMARAGDNLSSAVGNDAPLYLPISAFGAGVIHDGYNYPTVVLCNGQEWMAENLRTAVYANGDTIPNVKNAVEWSNLTTGAWCHYDNDIQYENLYGKLYNWYTVVDSRNVCPSGWHVPSDAEWNTLIGYLDPSVNYSGIGNQSSIAGGMMKAIGTIYWEDPNTEASNVSGFSGLPGGACDFGSFEDVGRYAWWWSSSESSASSAWHRGLDYNTGNVHRSGYYKESGNSVRCIKD